MGLFNFVKEAGEKLWDNLTDHKGQVTKSPSTSRTQHSRFRQSPG
jgi:hypothetical protein